MLWVCDTDPVNGKASVVGISTSDPTSTVTHTITPKGTDGAFCNDVVVSADGALWITDSFGGRVLRIPADQLMTAGEAPVWLDAPTLLVGDTRTPFGVNGIALLNNELYLVNTAVGVLYRIDPTIESPTETDLVRVVLDEAASSNVALYNPDGVTALSSTELLIVENGLALPGKGKRVIRVALTPL
jgi:sugar lactone lactonase YvrE